MRTGLDPISFLVISFAGWINQRQQHVIDYLVEENRVLREQIGARRMRFTDEQRCRLATRAKEERGAVWAVARRTAGMSQSFMSPLRSGTAEEWPRRTEDSGSKATRPADSM
jgi:hypothetical protein